MLSQEVPRASASSTASESGLSIPRIEKKLMSLHHALICLSVLWLVMLRTGVISVKLLKSILIKSSRDDRASLIQ